MKFIDTNSALSKVLFICSELLISVNRVSSFVGFDSTSLAYTCGLICLVFFDRFKATVLKFLKLNLEKEDPQVFLTDLLQSEN